MGNVASWELVAARPVEGGVEVTAMVEHCDGTTRLVTSVAPLELGHLDEWMAVVLGKRIIPSDT